MNKIEESEKLIRWTEKRIHGLEFTFDGRKEIVAGCLDVAIEHHKAIILLIANQYYGAAFSLVRVIFETWVRGLWLNYCASDKEIEKFKDNILDKKFHELVEEVEKVDGYREGTISTVKEAGWNAMNSFTHSGYAQIERRFGETSIEPNYDLEEIEEVIDFTNATGLLCCLEISFLANDEELSLELIEEIKKIKS